MGSRLPIQTAEDDLQGLRESLHYPPYICSVRAWPWAARGSAELVMLYLAGEKLDKHMSNYAKAVVTLGNKGQIHTEWDAIPTVVAFEVPFDHHIL